MLTVVAVPPGDGNQRGTVEVQLGDVKCPARCQSIERAVFLLKDVFWKVITERMEDAFRSLGLIEITLALHVVQVGSTHNSASACAACVRIRSSSAFRAWRSVRNWARVACIRARCSSFASDHIT